MKRIFTLFLVQILFFGPSLAQGVVISELYSGGGGGSSTFKNDYIELYNTGDTDVIMTNWSVHYASCTGSFNATNLFVFSDTIKAKSYFLIKCGNTGTGGVDISPSPDATTTQLSLSAACGKVILSSTNTAFSGTDPSTADIVDKIAYGAANGGFESSPATAATVTTSLERKANVSSTPETMSIGGIDRAAGNGFDANNNSTDFVIVTNDPQNSFSPREPADSTGNVPSISYNPASLNLGTISVGTSNTSYYIITAQNLEGDVSIMLSGSPFYSISKDVNGTFGNAIVFNSSELFTPDTVYVKFAPEEVGDFEASLVHASMNYTGNTVVEISGNAIKAGDYLFSFDNCADTFDDFTTFSVKGNQVWACTNFGRSSENPGGDAPFGVQINGFSVSNNENEDWLISPSISITSDLTMYPFLSFWSRTRFAGAPIAIMASADYPGTGDPTLFAWTRLTSTLPPSNSDVWTLSENIDLSAYRNQDIFIAFVYTSTTVDGARWTIDDISIENKESLPPSTLTAGVQQINFGYTPVGNSGFRIIELSGQFLQGDVMIENDGIFQISVDSINFSNALTVSSQNINATKIYIKFAPETENQSFAANLSIQTAGVDPIHVALLGHTFDPVNTLDVVTWNIEWFSGINGPDNDELQEANALTVLENIDADLYVCPEIVDTFAFKHLADSLGSLGEFGYYIGKYASAVADATNPAYGDAQKIGFIYRKSHIEPINITPLFYTSNMADTAYNYWASGRFPLMMESITTINGVSLPVTYIMIHGKAQNSNDAYLRRKKASIMLKNYLDSEKANERVMIVGDFNDDLDFTIAEPSESAPYFPASSYSNIINDTADYTAVTLALSLSNQKSTASFSDVIDHIVVTNESAMEYVLNSAKIYNEAEAWVANYSNTTSDHYPVLASFLLKDSTVPTIQTSLGQKNLEIFPNPTTGQIELKYEGERGILELLNMNGQMVYSKQLDASKTLDLQDMTTGMYILRLRTGNTVYIGKLIKE